MSCSIWKIGKHWSITWSGFWAKKMHLLVWWWIH